MIGARKHPLLWLAAWLCFALLLATPAHAQSAPPDLPTYTGWLREAYAAAQRGDRLGLEDAAARLEAAERVRLPDGTDVPADNSWLRVALDVPAPDMTAIGARLGAVLDALALPDSAAPPDARARLQDILAKPPFAENTSSDNGWWRTFWNWVGRMLESLFRPVGRAVSVAGEPTAWVIAIGGGILLLVVIAYVVRGLRRNVVRSAEASDDPEAHLTASTALEQASGMARGGDYRTAVRYLYLSALLRLDERNILRYDRALTNREYLDRVRDNAALRAQLGAVVETFDRVWYGHLPLDAATFANYERQVEKLRSENF